MVRALLFCCALVSLPTWGATLTFEGLDDLQDVGNFYAGVTFTNAIAENFSLNEAEVPPKSGTTVALNGDGLISIDWASPATNFSGFFTHTAPLTLNFFLSGVPVGNAVSIFSNNLGDSGDPGSSPNELIAFTGVVFDSLQVDSEGGYALDDISFDNGGSSTGTPEPGTTGTAIAALVAVLFSTRRSRRN